MARHRIAAYLEIGPKRTFAGALEWPGWCRSGRTEEAALEALLASAGRYANAIGGALGFELPPDVRLLEVVERLAGGAATDFGVPGEAPSADDEPLDDAELTRQITLLKAAWRALDHAAAEAEGRELRKGPRGGGRTLGKIVGHVSEAERAYLGQLGSRSPADGSTSEMRRLMVEVLRARARGEPLADPRNTRTPWSPRYFVRRAAWHALDHAWEIEDRVAG
ncbi:MAG TPA: hypothetical protein VFN14_08775 [Candidatus Limnocylindria bacterium]|nr:hypothetical protein [Candidatus Limnocylindria bacterium]